MAIYVPGVPEYFPKFQAFTPDYKFLSNVLQAKTNKYSTNYKALNDQYNKVVYGDLSRQDTSGRREQFVNNLGPMLEKVSGMDLSLAENVNSAQALFAPFYEDNLIVKDLVYTKAYQNEVKNSQMMRTSLNEDVRENWWQEGDKELQYRMQDFINASEEDALRMSNPTYHINPNIYRRGMEYLKSQGYDVSVESAPKQGNFWRIKNEGGQLVTERALNDVKKHLMSDPVVRDGYAAKAFVDSRGAAEQLLKEGSVSSIEEGVLSWSVFQLEGINVKLAEQIKSNEEELEVLKSDIDKWESQINIGQGPIPGSEDYKKMQESIIYYNALEVKTERNRETLKQSVNTLDEYNETGNGQPVIGRAWNYLMTANMEEDFSSVAFNFSNIKDKKSFLVNQEEQDRRRLIGELQKKIANSKNKAKEQAVQIDKIATLGMTVGMFFDEETGEVYYGEQGEQEDNVVGLNDKVTETARNANVNEMASYIADAVRMNDEESGRLTENISKEKAVGLGLVIPESIKGESIQIKDFIDILLNEDNASKIPELFFNNEQIKKSEPGRYQLIKEDSETIRSLENDMYKVYAENLDNLELIDPKYKKLLESGISKPLVKEADGTYRMLTKDEFIEQLGQNIKDLKVDAKVLQETIGTKDYKTVIIGKGDSKQNGYRVSDNEVLLDPDKAVWVQAQTGDWYIPSEALLSKTPTGFKTDEFLIPKWEARGWTALRYEGGKKDGQFKGYFQLGPKADQSLKNKYGNKKFTIAELNKELKKELNEDAMAKNLKNANGSAPELQGFSYTTLGLFTADYNVKSGFLYDQQIDFLNKTLTKEPGYDQVNKNGQPVLFKQYYQHSAFSGDNVSDNIITSLNVSITGSKGFKSGGLSSQLLDNLNEQLKAVKDGIVQIKQNGVLLQEVPDTIANLFDKEIDQKNVVVTYKPATNTLFAKIPGMVSPQDEIKGVYTIREPGGEGKEDIVYEVVFPTSNDKSPLSLRSYQMLDPVMIKINSGNYKTNVTTPGKDFGFKESVKGGDIILNRNQNGEIYFDLVTYSIDSKTGDYVQDPPSQDEVAYFSEEEFMIYNQLYDQLVIQLEQKAKVNAATKQSIVVAYNKKKKAEEKDAQQ